MSELKSIGRVENKKGDRYYPYKFKEENEDNPKGNEGK